MPKQIKKETLTRKNTTKKIKGQVLDILRSKILVWSSWAKQINKTNAFKRINKNEGVTKIPVKKTKIISKETLHFNGR